MFALDPRDAFAPPRARQSREADEAGTHQVDHFDHPEYSPRSQCKRTRDDQMDAWRIFHLLRSHCFTPRRPQLAPAFRLRIAQARRKTHMPCVLRTGGREASRILGSMPGVGCWHLNEDEGALLFCVACCRCRINAREAYSAALHHSMRPALASTLCTASRSTCAWQ